MRRAALSVVLILSLLVAGTAAAVGPSSASPGVADPASTPAQPSLSDASPALSGSGAADAVLVDEFEATPETEMVVDLQPDRDAEWTVVVRYTLTDANETAAFRAIEDRFVAGEAGPSAELFANFAAGASERADREMAVVDAEREAVLYDDPEAAGVEDEEAVAAGELRLSFTWTAFLEADGDDLVLGDAFLTPTNGTWLSLEERQTLELRTPAGYTVTGTPGTEVALRDNAVVLEGPRTFPDERVQVVYSPSDEPPWAMLAIAVVVAALLIAAGLIGYRRFGGETSEPATGGEPAAAGGGTPGGTASEPAEPEPEPEEDLSLLSDEERVERLLERNDGRMRQADIVTETGWSDAKVSQLLSSMADEGRVEKLRLGRENLISLPDEGVGGDDEGGDRR